MKRKSDLLEKAEVFQIAEDVQASPERK